MEEERLRYLLEKFSSHSLEFERSGKKENKRPLDTIISFNLGLWGKFDIKIKVTGEVFPDVSQFAKRNKFIVNEGDLFQVEVLGTQFSYKNRINNQAKIRPVKVVS